MDSYHAPLDHGGLAFPDVRNHSGWALGLWRSWLGWILGLGPGRNRIVPSLDFSHGFPAFGNDAGEARHDEEVECLADIHHLPAIDLRHSAHSQRLGAVSPRVCAIEYWSVVLHFSGYMFCCLPVLLHQKLFASQIREHAGLAGLAGVQFSS